MVQGTLRHSGHRGDKTSLSDISKSVVIYSKVVGGNLSQWIHPSALPGLPRTSGTIVSCSRNTSRSEATLTSFLSFLLSFVFTVFSPQVLLSPHRDRVDKQARSSYHLTSQVELFFLKNLDRVICVGPLRNMTERGQFRNKRVIL